MKTLIVDTHKVIEALQARGFSASQAEGITETLRELDLSDLTTKQE